jgi:PA14 domain-containing protein
MRFGKMGSAALALGLALGSTRAQDKPQYTFGTTVVDSSGLQGRVYQLKRGTMMLPKFSHMHAIGSIYTTSLNVWPQSFDEGFPNITDRFEWFAIEYTGRLWLENSGHYRFSLLADDGAKLYLNNELVIDNDGLHTARAISGSATLTRGVHEIKVEYFQGPRFTVALVLAVAPPDMPWRLFNMNDFKPPSDPEQLPMGKISDIRRTTQ